MTDSVSSGHDEADGPTRATVDAAGVEPLPASLAGWLPIETAPITPFEKETWYRNVCRVVVWGGNYVDIGIYGYTERGKGRWQSATLNYIIKPTHWMPMPAGPASDVATANPNASTVAREATATTAKGEMK